jgi:hypothetical protein
VICLRLKPDRPRTGRPSGSCPDRADHRWLAGWQPTDAGIEIQVRFESGEGIVANKTEVMYKGMSVGKVKAWYWIPRATIGA